MSLIVIISLLIPLAGTTLGSAMVFFLKDNINPKLQKILLGFASGVMIAASIWSLLEPAISTYNNFKKWLIPAIGFLVGIGFLLLLDYLIPQCAKSDFQIIAFNIGSEAVNSFNTFKSSFLSSGGKQYIIKEFDQHNDVGEYFTDLVISSVTSCA